MKTVGLNETLSEWDAGQPEPGAKDRTVENYLKEMPDEEPDGDDSVPVSSSDKCYMKAMIGLPGHVDLIREFEWIAAHPAMSRLDRSSSKTRIVRITARDITRPPHGSAPSRRAVTCLQHWANAPREFHKLLLNEYKDKKKAAASSGIEDSGKMMDDLTEVKRLLDAISDE